MTAQQILANIFFLIETSFDLDNLDDSSAALQTLLVIATPHGSDLEIIAAVVDPIQIARYLKHTGMPAAPPARAGVKMRVVCDEYC